MKSKPSSSSGSSVADILREITADRPPSARRDAIFDELRAQEKTIKSALASGWSASQLASRLRERGVKASEERLRSEIRKIAGLAPRVKGSVTKT
jgi:hypothetical protein